MEDSQKILAQELKNDFGRGRIVHLSFCITLWLVIMTWSFFFLTMTIKVNEFTMALGPIIGITLGTLFCLSWYWIGKSILQIRDRQALAAKEFLNQK